VRLHQYTVLKWPLILLALFFCCCAVQAVGDAPVVRALSRVSRADSVSSSTMDPLKHLLERFASIDGVKGGRGGAEALFVLQVRNDTTTRQFGAASFSTQGDTSLRVFPRRAVTTKVGHA